MCDLISNVPYGKKILGINIFVFCGSLISTELNFHEFNQPLWDSVEIFKLRIHKTRNLLTEAIVEQSTRFLTLKNFLLYGIIS